MRKIKFGFSAVKEDLMYIAHIRKTDKQFQTVEEHTNGVAKLAEKYSSRMKISSIIKLTSLLHDVGKMNTDFNDYIKGESKFKRGDIDHSYAGAKYIIELSEKTDDKNVSETALFIARVIISHHGLHDWVDENYKDYLEYRVDKTDRYQEIRAGIKTLAGDEELKDLLIAAAEEFGAVKKELFALCGKNSVRFSFYMGMFERFAESILIDADRTDTAEFMDAVKPAEFNTAEIWEDMLQNLNEKCARFRENTDRISTLRMSISDRCAAFADSERRICRLVVPTGGGKTISSLRFAVNYCRKFGKKKIFYIAPFMSILEQNSEVIRSVTGDEALLEHHSNIIAEMDGDGNELAKYETRCERWNDPVIATTAVQFLNTLFSGKTSSVRRFHSLENSVIIIDEVQSLPIKCVYLFDLAMNFLSNVCGSVIVLCSATQPALDDDKLKYPLILDEEESMTGDYSEDFKSFRRTELISDIRTEQYTFEEAADYAYEKFLENDNLLMILNTKKAAAELFKMLRSKCGNDVYVVHLSTNMCPAHRKEKLDRVRGSLDENKPVICVTTQLIEAGVDISFNCVIRSAAGADSIAQAAGRCNRHGRDDIRPVYVINIKDEKLGKGLEQISTGRDIFIGLVRGGKYDMMSNEAMMAYFKKLYSEYENGKNGRDELEYYAKDVSLLDLLSKNRDRVSGLKNKEDIKYRAQAFKTAGELFKVIDENTRDIIVPYNDEAEEIILRLSSDISAESAARLLRKAQKYTVAIYPSFFGKLLENNGIYPLNYGEIYALDKSRFSDDLGISSDDAPRELLIY